MAGGPEHGREILLNAPMGLDEPEPAVASDGAICPPVAVRYAGTMRHAVFAHPAATPAQLHEAERLFDGLAPRGA